MSWRRLFPAIFLFSCVDGFISNWLYPALLPLLYRDFLVLGVYLLFIVQEPVGNWVGQLRDRIGNGPWFLFILFTLIGLLQIFNPLSPGMLIGLLGFKVLYFYWPLAILAYAYVDSLNKARSLVKTIVYFSIPINLFALYQFWQGPEFLVATFGPAFERATIIAHIEGARAEESFLRVIGTFASSGQFSSFLLINAMLCFALLFSSKTNRQRLIPGGCGILTFLAMLATGSRAGLIVLILETIGYALLCSHARRVVVVTLISGFSLYYGFAWLGESVIARFESLRDLEMVDHRTMETTQGMFILFVEQYPLGRGLGTASTATRHLAGDDSSDWELVENHLSKLQLETGLPGVVTFFLFLVVLSVRWLKRWKKLLEGLVFDFGAALTAYCLTLFFTVGLFGNFDFPPHSVFLPALVGIVARLSALGNMMKQKPFDQQQKLPGSLRIRPVHTQA